MGALVGPITPRGATASSETRWQEACEALSERSHGQLFNGRFETENCVVRYGQSECPPVESSAGVLLLDASSRVRRAASSTEGTNPMPQLGGQNFSGVWLDRAGGTAHLYVDRLASRRLVYTGRGDVISFGSELRFLTPFMDEVAVDNTVLGELGRFRWLVGHETGLLKARRVPAGCRTVISASSVAETAFGERVWRPRGSNASIERLTNATQWPEQGFPSPEPSWLREALRAYSDRAMARGSAAREWASLGAEWLDKRGNEGDPLLLGTIVGMDAWYRAACDGFRQAHVE